MQDNFLSGKVAIVTGGGRGLGEAICRTFARYGAIVVVADINDSSAGKVTREINQSGGEAISYSLDVREEGSATFLMTAVLQRYRRIDILVNNAGIDQTASVEEMPLSKWQEIIGVNLTGAFIMSQLAFEFMTKNEHGQGGNIINICSTASKMFWANASAYHASKSGLLGLSHALYVEGKAKNINVSAVIAGGMRTPFLFERFPDIDPSVLQDPQHVAETISYILSLPKEVTIPEIMVLPQKETSWF